MASPRESLPPVSLQDVVRQLGARQVGPGDYRAKCPAHNGDNRTSLSITEGSEGRVLFACHAHECSFESIALALGIEPRQLMGDSPGSPAGATVTRHPSAPQEVTLAALAAKFGLEPSYLAQHGWAETNGGGRVAIPYRDERGHQVYSKLRLKMTAHGNGARFKVVPAGVEQIPYGVHLLRSFRKRTAATTLVLVEGESDALTLWRRGIPALGIPGANAARTLQASHLDGYDEVLTVQENDSAGEKFPVHVDARLNELGFAGGHKVVRLPESHDGRSVKDATDYAKAAAETFGKLFRRAMADARPFGNEGLVQRMLFFGEKTAARRRVEFLWRPFFPLGYATLMVGDPGEGKSLLGLYVAARLSRGFGLPGDPGSGRGEPVTSLIFSQEDPEEAIERLRFYDADLQRTPVHRPEARIDLTSEEGRTELEALIRAVSARYVLLDPLSSYTTAAELNKAEAARALMDELSALATRTSCSIVAVRHLNKTQRPHSVQDLVMGSRELTAAIRSGVWVVQNPMADDERFVAHFKANYSTLGQTKTFRLSDSDADVDVPNLSWVEAPAPTAQELIEERRDQHSVISRKAAIEFVIDYLAAQDNRRAPTSEVLKVGRGEGHTNDTLRAAAWRSPRIESVRSLRGGYARDWVLLEDDLPV